MGKKAKRVQPSFGEKTSKVIEPRHFGARGLRRSHQSRELGEFHQRHGDTQQTQKLIKERITQKKP